LQVLPRSWRILRRSYQDLRGSSMFLPKIFKGPLWILPRSSKICKDLWRSFADLTKILPRSVRIFKDLWWPFADLIEIFEDLQFPCKDLWGSSKTFKDPLWTLRRSLRILKDLNTNCSKRSLPKSWRMDLGWTFTNLLGSLPKIPKML